MDLELDPGGLDLDPGTLTSTSETSTLGASISTLGSSTPALVISTSGPRDLDFDRRDPDLDPIAGVRVSSPHCTRCGVATLPFRRSFPFASQ